MGVELESKTDDSCFSPIQSVTEDYLLPGTSTQADSHVKVGKAKALRGRSDCQSGRVGDPPQTNPTEVTEHGSTIATYDAYAVDCQTEEQRV